MKRDQSDIPYTYARGWLREHHGAESYELEVDGGGHLQLWIGGPMGRCTVRIDPGNARILAMRLLNFAATAERNWERENNIIRPKSGLENGPPPTW